MLFKYFSNNERYLFVILSTPLFYTLGILILELIPSHFLIFF